MHDPRVHEGGKEGEKPLEEGEEWGVVEGPGAGLIGIPLGEREGAGQSEPMAVDFEIC